jgi:hypothetical protein
MTRLAVVFAVAAVSYAVDVRAADIIPMKAQPAEFVEIKLQASIHDLGVESAEASWPGRVSRSSAQLTRADLLVTF